MAVEDGRHVAALAGGGDACDARRGKTERRRGKGRLTGGPGVGFLFCFLFFLGYDRYVPLCCRCSRGEKSARLACRTSTGVRTGYGNARQTAAWTLEAAARAADGGVEEVR